MTIEIRTFGQRDRGPCAVIFARAWAHAFPDIPRVIDEVMFDHETEGETILVAHDHGAVLGFAAFYCGDNFLHHLYIDPNFHGRGAGKALVEKVREAAMAPIALKCSLRNTQARGFYAHLGFREAEQGEDQYGSWVRLVAPGP